MRLGSSSSSFWVGWVSTDTLGTVVAVVFPPFFPVTFDADDACRPDRLNRFILSSKTTTRDNVRLRLSKELVEPSEQDSFSPTRKTRTKKKGLEKYADRSTRSGLDQVVLGSLARPASFKSKRPGEAGSVVPIPYWCDAGAKRQSYYYSYYHD